MKDVYLWSPIPQKTWQEVTKIDVDGTAASLLEWKELPAKIELAENPLVFHLDLGWENLVFRPQDNTHFQALLLVLDHFCKTILSSCVSKTLAVRLYQGSVDLSSLFPHQWWQETRISPLQVFSDYLKRLASVLPDSVIPYIAFHVSNRSVGSILKEISFERFSSTVVCIQDNEQLCFYESSEEVRTAILLPQEELYDAFCEEAIDRILEQIKMPFRFVNAQKLNEEWGGLDEIIIPTASCISHHLQRQLNGFIAAGGEVKIEKTNRSRGI